MPDFRAFSNLMQLIQVTKVDNKMKLVLNGEISSVHTYACTHKDHAVTM